MQFPAPLYSNSRFAWYREIFTSNIIFTTFSLDLARNKW